MGCMFGRIPKAPPRFNFDTERTTVEQMEKLMEHVGAPVRLVGRRRSGLTAGVSAPTLPALPAVRGAAGAEAGGAGAAPSLTELLAQRFA